jgi:hypothetical protein
MDTGEGSYGKSLAIYANVAAKADAEIRRLASVAGWALSRLPQDAVDEIMGKTGKG